MNAPNYARLRGPGDFDAPAELEDDSGMDIEDRTEELAQQYTKDEAKRQTARDWIDGTMDGDWYSNVEAALIDLHSKPAADIAGSDLLERLYRLARPIGEAFENKIGEMAREDAEAEFARFEANSPVGDA